MAKCPKCEQSITRLDIESTPVAERFGRQFTAVLLVCPNADCRAAIGAAVDPTAIGNDIVARIKEILAR